MKRSLILALLLLAAFAPPALALGPGKIEGTVTPVEAAQEIEVCMVESTPSETCTVPASNGAYVLSSLPVGPQKVEFLPSFRSRLVPQYWDHKNRLIEASTISVGGKDAVKGIDADLIEGGVIVGKVTALSGGAALAGVEVCAKSTASPPIRSCGETDPSGEYELHSLLTGSYKVSFWGAGASAEYQPQLYGGGTPVSVANGGETTGIDVALAKGGEISGTLTAASSGATLTDISVCLFTVAGSGSERCTYSDAGGTYRFQGLRSDSYQVGFSLSLAEIGGEGAAGEEDGFQTQYFPQAASRSEAQSLSLVAPQAVSGIDARLLGPPPPPPPAPPVVVSAPLIAAPVVIPVPPTKKGCKHGYRKQKVKGKTRCVEVHKKKHKGKKKTSKTHGGKRAGK